MSNPPAPTAPITQAEFARLVGVSKQMVGKGIKRGRIPERFLDQDGVGPPRIADIEGARRAWLGSADHSKAPLAVKERGAAMRGETAAAEPLPRSPRPAPPIDPPSPPGASLEPEDLSLLAEQAREKFWKANLAEIEFKKRSGELVDAMEMTTKIAGAFAKVRGRLTAVPARAKQQIPHLTAADVGLLDKLVREALEELVIDLETAPPDDQEAAVA